MLEQIQTEIKPYRLKLANNESPNQNKSSTRQSQRNDHKGNSPYESLNVESELYKMGYQISGTNRRERWNILVNRAVPKLGKERIVQFISSLISFRKSQKNGEVKYKHAIREWEHDIRELQGMTGLPK